MIESHIDTNHFYYQINDEHNELADKMTKNICTHLTLPPQNWQSSPCQPSGHIHVSLKQVPPFKQELSLMHFPNTTLLQ